MLKGGGRGAASSTINSILYSNTQYVLWLSSDCGMGDVSTSVWGGALVYGRCYCVCGRVWPRAAESFVFWEGRNFCDFVIIAAVAWLKVARCCFSCGMYMYVVEPWAALSARRVILFPQRCFPLYYCPVPHTSALSRGTLLRWRSKTQTAQNAKVARSPSLFVCCCCFCPRHDEKMVSCVDDNYR